jgi:hypothetical protein
VPAAIFNFGSVRKTGVLDAPFTAYDLTGRGNAQEAKESARPGLARLSSTIAPELNCVRVLGMRRDWRRNLSLRYTPAMAFCLPWVRQM